MTTCADRFIRWPKSVLPGRDCAIVVEGDGWACPEHSRAARKLLSTPISEAAVNNNDGGAGNYNTRAVHPRYNEVRDWLRAYTGNNEFLISVRATARGETKWDRMTDRQVDAVAKFIDNAAKPPRIVNETGRDLTNLPAGRTYAAVENGSEGITFIIIDNIKAVTSKWAGWVFVKQQQGPNEVRMGSQRPGQTYVGNWPTLIDKVLADPVAAVQRYGLELGICGVCSKALTNDESRSIGIGPVCLGKLEKGFNL